MTKEQFDEFMIKVADISMALEEISCHMKTIAICIEENANDDFN